MIIPAGYAHCLARLQLTGDNDEMVCTFGVDYGAGFFDQTEADAISAAAGTFFKGITCSMYYFAGVNFSVGVTTGDPVQWSSTSGAGNGTRGASAAPQNTSILIKKTTALGGRKHRGRMYVPGVFESDVDNAGNVLSTAITGFDTLGTNFLSALTTASTPMVLLHSEAATAPTPVVSLKTDKRVATQRRRLR